MLRKLVYCLAAGIVALPVLAQSERVSDYVNPIIGTNGMGHTFPGACVPFGLVQLSPDTDTIPHNVNGEYQKDAYKYCAGYQYSDPTIVGFSHTHLSGTGHSDLGDILIMPATGELKLNPGRASHPEEGYRSRYSHATERVSAGYYEVKLDDYGVKAQLTATPRVGVHKYTFPAATDGHLVLDLTHGIYNYDGKVLWTNLRVENDTLLTGYRITNGWARTNYTYFAISFSQPIKEYGYVDKKGALTDKYYADKANNAVKAAEEGADCADAVLSIVDSIYDNRAMQPERSGVYNAVRHIHASGSVKYDLVGKLVAETGLTRKAVVEILTGIEKSVFDQFKDNPEEFIIKAAELINDEKATAIIQHITYNMLDERYDTDIFTEPTIKGKLDVNAMKVQRHLYDHLVYDSANERKFASELDINTNVAVYVKLPDSFYISTPVGRYNPDWAIAFYEGSVKHIYFVAETKGSMSSMQLRLIEDAKIHCAREHFKAISNGNVVYDVVDSYETLLNKVMR